MSGFRTNSFASVFSIEPKSQTWTKCRICIQNKNKATEQYETKFSGFVDFVGTACASKIANLKNRLDGKHPVRIRLKDVDLENSYDPEKKITYWNPKVWSFETEEEFNNNSQQGGGQPYYDAAAMMAQERMNSVIEAAADPVEDEGLPW